MRLNPFRGIPNRREVWAWGMYDLANQSFQLLINTLLFSLYLKEVIVADPGRADSTWALFVGASMIIVVVLSPPVGALADARAWKKELLVATGVGAALLTASLALLGPGMVAAAAVVYVLAAVLVGLGENLLGAFLPELATPSTMGRISALGWSMSYLGALLLLIITAIVVFGLGATDPARWRWLFVMAGLWFLMGMTPTVVILRERARPLPRLARRHLLRAAIDPLLQSARESRRFRQFLWFMLAFFVYSLGVNTVIYFAGLIGRNLGFEIGHLVLFALEMTVAAGAGAIFAARYQDRLGHRRTILLFLAVWLASSLALALMRLFPSPEWAFWATAAGLGLGLGGIGTASRAMVGMLTPSHKSGEFFGVSGMVYKLSAIAGPVSFGLVSGSMPTPEAGQAIALFMLAGFFGAGLLLMLRVDERAGLAAAREAERQAGAA